MADETTIIPAAETLPVEQQVTPVAEVIPVPVPAPYVPEVINTDAKTFKGSVGNNPYRGWNVLFTFNCTCGKQHTTQAQEVWASFDSVSELVVVQCQDTGNALKIELQRDHPLKTYDPAKDVNKQTGPAIMRHLS